MASRGIIGFLSRQWRSLCLVFNSARHGRAGDPRHRLGALGERLAAQWLARNGYKVLYKNYRPRGGGEVDVVCRDRKSGEIVFIEVKTRSADDGVRPSEAVDRKKQTLIARGALSWLRALGNPDVAGRFDVVEVLIPDGPRSATIAVIRDAYPAPPPYHY